jgi:hypothetical protein
MSMPSGLLNCDTQRVRRSPPTLSTTVVRLFLTAGQQRIVEQADAARLDGSFFVITKRHHPSGRNDTVLTLRSQDVVGAEIVKDGVVTEYVLGGCQRSD